jgi:3-phosphoshikimate 1-carboxyvinyltransferase
MLAGLPDGDDVHVMVDALRAAGAEIVETEQGTAVVPGPRRPARIDVRASGTTMRFLTAWAATQPVDTTLDGTARMRQRPLGPLCAALAALGVEIRCAGGYPPVTLHGPLPGG